jgi:hypothetical protein
MAQAKFDIKTEVTRPLYAYVGVTDRAVGAVRESVTDLQKRFADVQKDVQTRVAGVSKTVHDFDFEPTTLRTQATTVVNGRVEALSKDAHARRAAVEARLSHLQQRVRGLLKDGEVTYDQLVTRGETLVERIRRQESTQDAVTSAQTSVAKAKTTRTQATTATKSATQTAERAARSTAKSAQSAAKTTTATARKRSTAPQSSAKATTTTAKRAAKSAGRAATDAAKKVGD